MVRNFKYSFMKQNPNLLVPNGGILMMREKSTMEVISQMGEAGQLQLVINAKITEKAQSFADRTKQ